MDRFTHEFVDDFLFGKGLTLKDYVIRRTPVSECICCGEGDAEFDLLISNDKLRMLVLERLISLNVSVVDQDWLKAPHSTFRCP